MTCKDIENNLLEIIESGKTAEIKQHLAECKACLELFAEYQGLFMPSNKQSTIEVPDFVWRNIQQKINLFEELKSDSKIPFFKKSFSLLGKAAIVTAAVVFGIYLGSGTYSPQQSEAAEILEDYSSFFADLPAYSISEVYFDLQETNQGADNES